MKFSSLSPQYFKFLRIKYALALSFIAVVLLSSSFLMQKTIDNNSSDARVINISGRQRMLSQKITKTALIIYNSKSDIETSQAATELNEALSIWIRSHTALQNGDPTMGIPSRELSDDIQTLFKEITPYFDQIASSAESISKYSIASTASDDKRKELIHANVRRILANEKVFLPLMDKITFTFDKEAKLKIDKLKNVDKIILILGFAVLLFEFLFIFRPSTRQLNLAVKDVVEKQDQLKVANSAIANALDESERLTKLANAANDAKSAFLANMSHEIRTPMNSILGFAEILKGKISDPVQKHYLSNMISSGNMLLALINDVLDLSKIEAGKLVMNFKSVNVHKITGEVAETFRQMAENKGLDFSFTIDPDIPKGLILDEIRLRQILFNLLGNAVKFTDRGNVSLNIGIQGYSDKHSTYNIFFEIEDTGIGIAESECGKIFEAFEQQSKQDSRKYSGTGLGLSITKKLVRLLNGEIWVESKLKRGSKFTFRLDNIPVASVIEDSLDVSTSYSFRSASILVIDDVDINRELLAEYLADQPVEIRQAANGKEALLKIEQEKPDIILTDMRMPEMDGFQLTSIIKASDSLKDIVIIAVTASSMAITKEEILRVCDGYLQKPVSSQKLFRELAKYISAETAEEGSYDMTIDGTGIASENIDEIVSYFDEKYIKELKEQIDILSYDELDAIVRDVRENAGRLGCDILLRWSEDVENSMALFDMEQLEKKLKEFEPTINSIKELK